MNNKSVPSKDPISALSYVTSVNPYRTPIEQHVEALQEAIRTTLVQVQSL